MTQLEAHEKAFKAIDKKHEAIIQTLAIEITLSGIQGVGWTDQINWNKVNYDVKRILDKLNRTVRNANRQLDKLQWSGFSLTDTFHAKIERYKKAYDSMLPINNLNVAA